MPELRVLCYPVFDGVRQEFINPRGLQRHVRRVVKAPGHAPNSRHRLVHRPHQRVLCPLRALRPVFCGLRGGTRPVRLEPPRRVPHVPRAHGHVRRGGAGQRQGLPRVVNLRALPLPVTVAAPPYALLRVKVDIVGLCGFHVRLMKRVLLCRHFAHGLFRPFCFFCRVLGLSQHAPARGVPAHPRKRRVVCFPVCRLLRGFHVREHLFSYGLCSRARGVLRGLLCLRRRNRLRRVLLLRGIIARPALRELLALV